MEATSDATKILEKGPEYLRKQMELDGETKGHISAVERLAASKPKYVRSQQAVNSTEEPVTALGSASVSSAESSKWSLTCAGKIVKESYSCGEQSSPGQVRRYSSKKRPDSLLLYRQKSDPLRKSINDRKQHAKRKLLLSSATKSASLPEATEKDCKAAESTGKAATPEGRAKECSSNEGGSHPQRRANEGAERSTSAATGAASRVNKSANLLTVPECEGRSAKGVGRSHSDISSRYSKSFADFDAFFKYCGLGGEVIESLGKENFSARSDEVTISVRRVSIATSDGSFGRCSGNGNSNSECLLEDELHDKMRQGTSVVERNARIIKWLYSCKNATEAGKRLRDLD
ncbi:protein FAM110C-like [Brachionichthys hirsutus]|uniref:protein FAM110C-like n=1 Tax=Brachionichthys hirsutus TaxID=412623 RepID=UPI00360448D1